MKNPIMIAALAIASLTLGLGFWSWQQWQHNYQPPLTVSTKLSTPRALPAFDLLDMHGQPFNLASIKGHWQLFFYGFTNCPDVCPNTLAMLKQVTHRLGEQAPRIVFVSVDPGRDTPELLKNYVHYFDPSFVGVTGTSDSLSKFANALHIPFIIGKPDAEGKYDVEHSGSLVLVSPESYVVAYLTPPFTAQQVIDDLSKLIHQ